MGHSDKAPYYVMAATERLAADLVSLQATIHRYLKDLRDGRFPKHAERGFPTIGTTRAYIKEFKVRRRRIIRELGQRHHGGR